MLWQQQTERWTEMGLSPILLLKCLSCFTGRLGQIRSQDQTSEEQEDKMSSPGKPWTFTSLCAIDSLKDVSESVFCICMSGAFKGPVCPHLQNHTHTQLLCPVSIQNKSSANIYSILPGDASPQTQRTYKYWCSFKGPSRRSTFWARNILATSLQLNWTLNVTAY